MNDALIHQRNILSPGSAAWHKDFAEDFSAGVCPHCGSYLSFEKDVMDKDFRQVIISECSTSKCERCASRIGESTDRHGLV